MDRLRTQHHGWGDVPLNQEQVAPEPCMSSTPHFEMASAAPITVPKPSFIATPLFTSSAIQNHKEEDLSYSLGSIALKDSYDSPRSFGVMPSSPHSTQSCDQASFDSHPRGFFSEPSSCAQSPTPQRFSGSELSASLSTSPMASLPSRLGGSSSSWEGTENYWTSTTRESRMSIYSPMHSLSLGTPIEAVPTSPSPEVPASISIGPPLKTEESAPSPFLRSLSSPAVPSNAEDEPLLTKKEMRKSIKREKLQAKVLKKRQKSIAKLHKELTFLEQRSHLVLSASSPATTVASVPSSPIAAPSEPRQKRVLQSSQSLKLAKSKSRLSTSVPYNPTIPLPAAPIAQPAPPALQTRTTPRKLLRAQTWRPASPSTHIANIAPTVTTAEPTIVEEKEKIE